jgi:AraC-like DNA-binding protein
VANYFKTKHTIFRLINHFGIFLIKKQTMNQHSWHKIFFLLLLPIVLFGQSNENNLNDFSYDKLAKLYFEHDKDSSKQIIYAKTYLNKAKKEKNAIKIGQGYYLYSLLNVEDKAISYLDSVIKYSTNGNHFSFPISAYLEKAVILKKQYKFDQAMNCYLTAEKYALQKNNWNDYYTIRFYIGVTKSEELGEVKEALAMYRECNQYYRGKNIRDPKYSYHYQSILFAIADAHVSLRQTDSATYYNQLGYKEAKIAKNDKMQYLFTLSEGANQVLKKNYKQALDSIRFALPKMILFKNEGNVLASYFYLGKAYEELGKKEIAVNNYVKVDSIYQKRKQISPEFVSGYYFLIAYYKNKGDKENQLKYLTTFMTIDSSLQKTHNKLYKLLVKEYDLPHALKEKETLIASLKSNQSFYYWGIAGLIIVVIVSVSYGVYQHNLKKAYRIRFEEIIAPKIDNSIKITKSDIDIEDKIKNIGIAEEVILKIIDKLNDFEREKGYLKSNMTLNLLSKEFETNSSYLSKIINVYKNKNYNDYINDLRINEVVLGLQQQNNLKKYTLEALAKEFGFNNSEAFSIAFYKKMKLKPRYFINELKK